ncbi:MAG: general secretion pathway protein GspB [Pseudomonadales bacterium]
MSYILDAVRKADQERRENLAPVAHSLSAQSHSTMPASSRLGSSLPAILAGVVLLNLAGWYWSSNAHHTSESASAAPLEKTPVIISDPTVSVENETQLTQVAQLSKVQLWQSPVDAQNAVRSLEFSFHVYADDVAKRTIIINGQRVAEGDRISQDLSLSEITSSGVILRYQDSLLIETDILEQW